MPTTTTNLILTKPAGSEPAAISVINTNMDIIDGKFSGAGATIPASGVEGTAVTATGVVTLTNKTLTSPVITSPTITSGASVSGGLSVSNGLTVSSGASTFADNITVSAGRTDLGSARLILPKGTAFPTSPTPSAGETFYRTDTSPAQAYAYNGTSWIQLGGMVKLDEQILGSDTASPITFSSIPGTYRHLRLVIMARSTRSVVTESILGRLNGDTGSNYHFSMLLVNAGTTSHSATANQTTMNLGVIAAASATSGRAGSLIIDIPDYARTTFHKMVFASETEFVSDTNTDFAQRYSSNLWKNTAAITSITILLTTGPNFLSGSTFTLYGSS